MKNEISKKDIPVKDRYIDVILEKIHNDIKQILKGYIMLDKKIDNFRKEMADDFRNLRQSLGDFKAEIKSRD